MTIEREKVLSLLAELSELMPELRMGQWMTMLASLARTADVESIYDVEDEELIPVMREFLEKRLADAEAHRIAGKFSNPFRPVALDPRWLTSAHSPSDSPLGVSSRIVNVASRGSALESLVVEMR